MTEEEISCGTKIRYLTRKIAKDAEKRCSRTGLKNLSPYKCGYCGLYHLGHSPGAATYRRRREGLTSGLGV